MTAAKGDTGHDRTKCGGRRRDGGLCTQPLGWGTTHPGVGRCKLHAGETPSHVNAARRQLAERELLAFGQPVDVDSTEALLSMVRMAAGMVAALQRWVEQSDDGLQEIHEFGGGIHHVEHVHFVMFREWCDRVVQYAAAAKRAGIDDRRIEMEETMAAVLGQLVRDLLGSPVLELDFEHQMAGLEEAGRLMRALPGTAT